jgi:hypothetical protein
MQFVDLYYCRLIPVFLSPLYTYVPVRVKKSGKMNIKAFPLATEFSTKPLPLYHSA